MNDFLILGSSIKESRAKTKLTLDLLQWLGFTINWEKSMLVPTQLLTFLGLSIDAQSPRKKILNIQSKCQKSYSQSHIISSRSGKPHKNTGSSPPCHLAGPSALQRITNTAHKIPTGLSRQLRDTHVPKQQCSHRSSVVAPEHSNRKWQYHQSSCPQAVHNLKRFQSRLGCMLPEPNCKWPLVSSGGQRSYQCSQGQSSLSCHQSLSQRQVKHHSLPLHGQHYSCCPC